MSHADGCGVRGGEEDRKCKGPEKGVPWHVQGTAGDQVARTLEMGGGWKMA